MKNIVVILLISFLVGCATADITVNEPGSYDIENEKRVSGSFDDVWSEMVENLSASFFVINNIAKDSGIINVSYSTNDASEFVDCGEAEVEMYGQTTVVNLARGGSFPWPYQSGIYRFEGEAKLEVSLDGRVNIHVVERGENEVGVSVNARYVVQKEELNFDQHGQRVGQNSYEGAFNTGSSSRVGEGVICKGNGELESRLLNLVGGA